jgi:hypothetical protein
MKIFYRYLINSNKIYRILNKIYYNNSQIIKIKLKKVEKNLEMNSENKCKINILMLKELYRIKEIFF